MMARRIATSFRLLSIVSLLLLSIGLAPVRAAAVAPATRGLSTARLELGLGSGPDQLAWMKGSGVPWKYRYQYLAGGVNTQGGWTHWQDPARPAGQFAADYMAASGAS